MKGRVLQQRDVHDRDVDGGLEVVVAQMGELELVRTRGEHDQSFEVAAMNGPRLFGEDFYVVGPGGLD